MRELFCQSVNAGIALHYTKITTKQLWLLQPQPTPLEPPDFFRPRYTLVTYKLNTRRPCLADAIRYKVVPQSS